MITELLVFGSKNFNNSIEEIKDNLGYSTLFFDFNKSLASIPLSIACVIIDSQVCKNKDYLGTINRLRDKPILLVHNLNTGDNYNFNNKISLPLSLFDLKNKIKNILATSKFNLNSSIMIKDYILNKNEKKLTRLNISISITEREAQLIELLFKEKKPLSKNFILKKIWNYSDNADTHTVETHIYRLRKKINNKFKDNNFIFNSAKGYLI